MEKRTDEIERILEKLRLAWLQCPNQRLCQLVWNIANNTGEMRETRDCFYVEDAHFEIELNRWFRKRGE